MKNTILTITPAAAAARAAELVREGRIDYMNGEEGSGYIRWMEADEDEENDETSFRGVSTTEADSFMDGFLNGIGTAGWCEACLMGVLCYAVGDLARERELNGWSNADAKAECFRKVREAATKAINGTTKRPMEEDIEEWSDA